MNKDYYNIIGVDKDATAKEIKQAYRKKAKELHPDVNKSADAEEKFKELSEAYSVLGDEENRLKYDNPSIEGPNFGFGGFGGFPGFGGFDNIGDFINANFNNPNNRDRHVKGKTVRINRSISLYEALMGTSINSKVRFNDTCGECRGTGGIGIGEACSFCSGSGHIVDVKGNMRISQQCPSCKGRGHSYLTRCIKCNGAGLAPFKREVNIDLPAGFSGGALTLSGKGGEGLNNGPPGDLILNISIDLPKVDKDSLTDEEDGILKKYLSKNE